MSHNTVKSLDVPEHVRQTLETYGFDADAFWRLRRELQAGDFPTQRNQVQGEVSPPSESALSPLPEPGSAEAAEDEQRGRQAISESRVAVAILNGGMATRFGGQVKGIVEVLDGDTFLALKLREVARAPGPVPVFLMNSFATDAPTRAHLEQNRFFELHEEQLTTVNQHVSIRLTPDGEIFRDSRGDVSLYAPGHGDLLDVLASSASFRDFAARGGRYVLVSNVDNLAATLNPRVIGAHIRAQKPVTVEVAHRAPNDKGGAPAVYRGKLQVLEGFRFPPDFDISQVPVFNTNTFIFNTEAVRSDYPLTWFRADKTVDQRRAVQFERLLGEVTAFTDAHYLWVPRHGPEGRFLPVKTPDDLISIRPAIRELFGLHPTR